MEQNNQIDHHLIPVSLFFVFLLLLPVLLICPLVSRGADRDRFQLGTLSHSLNAKAVGYLELSDWPAVAPDQSVRNVEVAEQVRAWSASSPICGFDIIKLFISFFPLDLYPFL